MKSELKRVFSELHTKIACHTPTFRWENRPQLNKEKLAALTFLYFYFFEINVGYCNFAHKY